jgi:ribosomal protein S18 acetylase RimI-like enzyme
MQTEYAPLGEACKKKALNGQKRYYYFFITGTAVENRRKGLCSRIVRHWQEIAGREGLSLWLEATTEYCKGVYERLGFEVAGEIVLGKGKADASGRECRSGEGVTIWGMIWWSKGGE